MIIVTRPGFKRLVEGAEDALRATIGSRVAWIRVREWKKPLGADERIELLVRKWFFLFQF
jgi:hypothetical protein